MNGLFGNSFEKTVYEIRFSAFKFDLLFGKIQFISICSKSLEKIWKSKIISQKAKNLELFHCTKFWRFMKFNGIGSIPKSKSFRNRYMTFKLKRMRNLSFKQFFLTKTSENTYNKICKNYFVVDLLFFCNPRKRFLSFVLWR